MATGKCIVYGCGVGLFFLVLWLVYVLMVLTIIEGVENMTTGKAVGLILSEVLVLGLIVFIFKTLAPFFVGTKIELVDQDAKA